MPGIEPAPAPFPAEPEGVLSGEVIATPPGAVNRAISGQWYGHPDLAHLDGPVVVTEREKAGATAVLDDKTVPAVEEFGDLRIPGSVAHHLNTALLAPQVLEPRAELTPAARQRALERAPGYVGPGIIEPAFEEEGRTAQAPDSPQVDDAAEVRRAAGIPEARPAPASLFTGQNWGGWGGNVSGHATEGKEADANSRAAFRVRSAGEEEILDAVLGAENQPAQVADVPQPSTHRTTKFAERGTQAYQNLADQDTFHAPQHMKPTRRGVGQFLRETVRSGAEWVGRSRRRAIGAVALTGIAAMVAPVAAASMIIPKSPDAGEPAAKSHDEVSGAVAGTLDKEPLTNPVPLTMTPEEVAELTGEMPPTPPSTVQG